jgi:hypothetical protein
MQAKVSYLGLTNRLEQQPGSRFPDLLSKGNREWAEHVIAFAREIDEEFNWNNVILMTVVFHPDVLKEPADEQAADERPAL